MDVSPLLVTHSESTPLKQPFQAGLDNVAKDSQTAAMFFMAMADERFDLTLTQRLADFFFRVVGLIREQHLGMAFASSVRLFNGRHAVHERHGQFGIVDVGAGVLDGQWQTIAVSHQMAFRTVFAPIGGIGAGLLPPKMARTEQLSMTPQARFTSPKRPNSSNRRFQIFCHTPAASQSRNRRQQVIPQPQFISWGGDIPREFPSSTRREFPSSKRDRKLVVDHPAAWVAREEVQSESVPTVRPTTKAWPCEVLPDR